MYTNTVRRLAFTSRLTAQNTNNTSATLWAKHTLLLMLLFTGQVATAQAANDTTYKKVLWDRSAKIVSTLELKKPKVTRKVTALIAEQYFQLNAIHDKSKAEAATIKSRNLAKEETDLLLKKEGDKKSAELKQLHRQFISLLEKRLNASQLEKVKDGMTFRVLPITWTAYLDMLQHLTPEQKDKMYAWLVEARELAMDEGSSDAKHAMFGKYKGKINNYLSAAGYDMKKEGEEWQKRIAAAKKEKQATQ